MTLCLLRLFVASCVEHLNLWRDLFLRNQRRPVRNNLLNLRPAARKTGNGGWPSKNQGRNLFREPFDSGAILTTHADAQLHLRNISSWWSSQRTMRRIHTNKLGQHLFELQSKSIESSAQNSIRRLDRKSVV